MCTCAVIRILWTCLVLGTQFSSQWEAAFSGACRREEGRADHRGDARVLTIWVPPLFPRAWISSGETRCYSRGRTGCTSASPCSSWTTTTQTWTSGRGGGSPFTGTGSMWARPPAAPTATPWSATCVWASCTTSPRTQGRSRWWQQISSTGENMRLTLRDTGSRPRPSSTQSPPSSPISAGRRTWS